MRCTRLSVALVLLCALTASPRHVQAQETLTLLSPGGRRALALARVNGQPMVALSDLAAAFGLTVREDTLADGLTVTYQNRVIVLTASQGLASVDGRVVSLPSPPVRTSRGWHVPIEFLDRALALVIDTPIQLRRRSGLIIVGDLRVPEIDIGYAVARGQARLTFEMVSPAPYVIEEAPQLLLVKFDADALDVRLPQAARDSLVAGVRVGDQPTWIAIALGSEYASYQSSLQTGVGGTSRLIIDVLSSAAAAVARVNERAATASRPPVAVPPAAVPPSPDAPPADAAPPLLEFTAPAVLNTVVIDPGHGGEDTGTTGPNGVLEKDVTLQVATRLRRAIESRLGLRVVMTRDGDRTIRLDERAAIANNNKADLFISLHANASLRPAPSGAEVYYLSLYDDAVETRLAGGTDHTVPVLGGGVRSIEVVSWDVAQVRHLDRSARFARIVDTELRRQVAMRPTGVQRAPFRVLVGANMPAVLVELGFLSNPAQAERLASASFQETLAQALFQSVVRYRASLRDGQPAAAAGGAQEAR